MGDKGLIDKVIQVGAYFDWITPTVGFVQDIANGPSCGFGVPINAAFSARDIETLLRVKGIKPWAVMVVDDLIIFRVRKRQAQWALYVLETAQVPVAYAPKGLKRGRGAGFMPDAPAPAEQRIGEVSLPPSRIFDSIFGRK